MPCAHGDLVGQEIIKTAATVDSDERARGNAPRFDRRPNPFTAFGICKAGGIAYHERTSADERADSRTQRVIRVAAPYEACRVRYAASRRQKRDETSEVIGKCTVRAPSDSDVEIIVLPHAPPIAFEIARKEQFGSIGRDRRRSAVEAELRFFGDDRDSMVAPALQMTPDGTEMTPGTDNYWRFNFIVDDPCVAAPPERPEGCSVDDANARAAQQEVIELATPDGVADDVRISGRDRTAANDAGPEARNLLERESRLTVLLGREIEQAEDVRRQPATTDFVARKAGAIEENDVPTCESEPSGAR